MTNTRFDEIGAFRDIESLNHYAEVTAAGEDPDATLVGAAEDEPRQRAHADAVGRGRSTPASRRGEPWIPVNENHAEINAEAAVADPDSVFHHYRRLIALRHTEPVVAHGDFTMLLGGRRARVRVHAPARRRRAARARELLRRGRAGRAATTRAASSCSATTRTRASERVLRPWEARVLRAMIDDAPRPGAGAHPRGRGRAACGADARPRRRRRLQGARPAGGRPPSRASSATRVALVEQPYLVAGRRSAAPAHQLDAAWLAVVEHLRGGELAGLPLVAGGRSSGARVACRTAAAADAVAVLCLAFPVHPPGKPEKSRLDELDGVEVPVLVIQGESDPFGMPPDAPGREVVVVPGTHSFTRAALGALTEAARAGRVIARAALGESLMCSAPAAAACPGHAPDSLLPPPRGRARRALPGGAARRGER